MTDRVEAVGDGLIAGAIAGLVSGVPSTVHALASGIDPLRPARAAGDAVADGR